MKGSTKLEQEIYEQFIILERYGGKLSKNGGDINFLLNKVNPVGGRFDLKNTKGLNEFRKKALEIAKKYKLPTTFEPVILFNKQ